MEVTPLAEKLEGEAWIGAYIGNWDAKGHRLDVYKRQAADSGFYISIIYSKENENIAEKILKSFTMEE